MNGHAEKVNESSPDTMRLGEVMQRTGWDKRYVRKLVDAEVLHVFQPPGMQRRFFRSEVEQLMRPTVTVLRVGTPALRAQIKSVQPS